MGNRGKRVVWEIHADPRARTGVSCVCGQPPNKNDYEKQQKVLRAPRPGKESVAPEGIKSWSPSLHTTPSPQSRVFRHL